MAANNSIRSPLDRPPRRATLYERLRQGDLKALKDRRRRYITATELHQSFIALLSQESGRRSSTR